MRAEEWGVEREGYEINCSVEGPSSLPLPPPLSLVPQLPVIVITTERAWTEEWSKLVGEPMKC